MAMPPCNQLNCPNPVESIGDTFCKSCSDALGFNEDHSVEHRPDRRGSIKRSHRAEGRNWVD